MCVRQYLADGLTVRDCCFGIGISEDTFCVWTSLMDIADLVFMAYHTSARLDQFHYT